MPDVRKSRSSLLSGESALRCEDELESPWTGGQILHDILRGMGLQIVEDDADPPILLVRSVDLLQEVDEVVAGMGVTDERYDLPGDQIHSRQQRHRPMADVVGIPCDEPMLLGHGFILDGATESLDARLLVIRDRDDTRIDLGLDGYLRLLVDHQHLHHLTSNAS